MSSSIQDIFRRHYRAYAATHKLPTHQLRAGYQIKHVRKWK
jgi:hypothetical protein